MLKILMTIGIGVMAGMVSHPILRQMTGWPPSADSFSILVAIVTMGAIGSAFVLAKSEKIDGDAPVASPVDAAARPVAEKVAAVSVDEPMHVSRLSDAASSRIIEVPHEPSSNLYRRDPMRLLNIGGELAYEARMRRGWDTSVDVLTVEGKSVASVRQGWFSYSVAIDGEQFSLRRLAFHLTSRYEVYGGPWNAASMRGDFLSFNPFELEHRGRVLARASGKLTGKLGMHRVELPTNRVNDERFVVAAIVMLRLQRDRDRYH